MKGFLAVMVVVVASFAFTSDANAQCKPIRNTMKAAAGVVDAVRPVRRAAAVIDTARPVRRTMSALDKWRPVRKFAAQYKGCCK